MSQNTTERTYSPVSPTNKQYENNLIAVRGLREYCSRLEEENKKLRAHRDSKLILFNLVDDDTEDIFGQILVSSEYFKSTRKIFNDLTIQFSYNQPLKLSYKIIIAEMKAQNIPYIPFNHKWINFEECMIDGNEVW